jgi:hypothetical protein
VVVLRSDEEDGVGLGDGGVDGLDCGGFVFTIEVLVIEGNLTNVDQREFDRGLQVSREEFDEGGAEGCLAEASRDACDSNRGDGS